MKNSRDEPAPSDADVIARHVQPWMDMVRILQKRVELLPRLSRSKYEHMLERADRVCRALLDGQVGIIPRSEAREYFADAHERCAAADEARDDRDAMLRLETCALLAKLARMASGSGKLRIGDLMVMLSEQRTPVPPGVKPVRFDALNAEARPAEVDEQGEQASKFFERYARAVLRELNKKYESFGTSFGHLLQTKAQPTFEHWCTAWTQATAAVASEWMFLAKGKDGTLKSAIRDLWRNDELTQLRGFGPGQFRRTLPTEHDHLIFTLLATPGICQVLDHDVRHWTPAATYSNVKINMADLHRVDTRSEAYSRGLNVHHIYMAVWLERVAILLADSQQGAAMSDDEDPLGDLPPLLTKDLAEELVYGQFRGVSALLTLLAQRSQGGRALSGEPSWYAGAATPSGPPGGAAEAAFTGAPWPIEVGYLERRHVVLESNESDLRSNSIGRIRLPWDLVGQNLPQWLDFALIVRADNRWQVLPVRLVPEQADKPDQEWVALTLKSRHCRDWDIRRLRRALTKAEWAFRVEGDGVFLSGAMILDAT